MFRHAVNNILEYNLILLVLLYLFQDKLLVTGFKLISKKLSPGLLDNLPNRDKIITGYHDVIRGKNADPLSPEGSWFLFNQNDNKNKKKSRRKKCKKNGIPYPKEGPVGPQGPRGYMGPPGPTGGVLSLEDIDNYIKNYLSEILWNNSTFDLKQTYRRFRPSSNWLSVALTSTVATPGIIGAQNSSVIKSLTVTFGPGQFKRGVVMSDGKFYVTRPGIYQIGVNILLKQKEKEKSERNSLDEVTLYICVDHCNVDRRLQWIGSLENHYATAAISGLLRLKRGQTIQILVSNPTSYSLEVCKGSTFSAALIGT